jgi:hypothetical protein
MNMWVCEYVCVLYLFLFYLYFISFLFLYHFISFHFISFHFISFSSYFDFISISFRFLFDFFSILFLFYFYFISILFLFYFYFISILFLFYFYFISILFPFYFYFISFLFKFISSHSTHQILKQNIISFSPPLPLWKTEGIDRMGGGLLNKVVLVFDGEMWLEDDYFGVLCDDEKNRGHHFMFWNLSRCIGYSLVFFPPLFLFFSFLFSLPLHFHSFSYLKRNLLPRRISSRRLLSRNRKRKRPNNGRFSNEYPSVSLS